MSKMVKLSDLITEISMGPFGSDIKVECFVNEGIPVLNGANLTGYKLVENGFRYVTKEKAQSFRKAIAKRGDIVITHRGTLGQISYIPDDSKFDEYVISQSQFRVALNEELVDPIYFVYYFHTSEGQRRLLANKCHVGVPALAQATTNFKLIEIPLPKFDVQRKIASILSSLDAKIELNNKINAELEAMAKTLYDYWFVQFDFPNVEGKPYKTSGGKMVYNEELKREIPVGWEVGTFGTYAKSKGGFAFKSEWWQDEGIPVIKIKDIQENYTLDLNRISYVDVSKLDIAKAYEAKAGDVVIAMTGATVGKYAIVPLHSKPILVNQRVALFDLGNEPINSLPFLINSLNQEYFRETVFTLASGAAQPNISNSQIDNIPLVVPNKELITDYNSKLISTYKTILNNQVENQHLSSLRDWLLPMLMNGQVTVGAAREVLGMVAEDGVGYETK